MIEITIAGAAKFVEVGWLWALGPFLLLMLGMFIFNQRHHVNSAVDWLIQTMELADRRSTTSKRSRRTRRRPQAIKLRTS